MVENERNSCRFLYLDNVFFKLSKIKIVSSIALSTIKIGKAVFNTGRGSKSCEDNNQGKYKRPELNSFLGSFDDPRVLISF